MILYFSGTGNSAHAAEAIADLLGDETLNLFERLRSGDRSPLYSEKPWVVVTPTYCWQIPHIVRDLLAGTPLEGSKKIWFVMTCGDDTGNAEKYLEALCNKKGLECMGHLPVKMPENYLAMFDTPDDEKAARIIGDALPVIKKGAELIKAGKAFEKVPVTPVGRLYSGAVNVLFYPLFVKDKSFYARDACIGCGKCESVCPMGNIKLVGSRPVWQGNCTHCMACIARCPAEAIEYGKKSKGQIRYYNPLASERR